MLGVLNIPSEICILQSNFKVLAVLHFFCKTDLLSQFLLLCFPLESAALGSRPGQGLCVGLLGKTLYSHSASLHPGV